jgi:CRISPR-associated protein Cmr1
MSGADPRGAPELRVPSFRGALRFWLRAWAGGVYGDADIEKVSELETHLFGSAEEGSKVSITIQSETLATEAFAKGSPIREGNTMRPTGRDYLYWSMASTGSAQRGNLQEAKQFIRPQQRFTLNLRLCPGADDDAQTRLIGAAWLLCQLGALGSRAQRTAGSVQVVSEPVLDSAWADLKFVPAQSLPELHRQLTIGLSLLRTKLVGGSASVKAPSLFDVLHPNACQVWVLQGPWRSADEAIEAIGSAMQRFRARRQPDSGAVAAWLQDDRRPPTVERAAFGLPLPFRYADGGPSDVLEGEKSERRRSPLGLRVTRLANGSFVGIAVLFHSQFLERGENIEFKKSHQNTAPPPNYDLLETFITTSFNAKKVDFV